MEPGVFRREESWIEAPRGGSSWREGAKAAMHRPQHAAAIRLRCCFIEEERNAHGDSVQAQGGSCARRTEHCCDRYGFRQIRSRHSKNLTHKEDRVTKRRDLSGVNVLISKRFVYFGRSARRLPRRFRGLIAGRGHRCVFPRQTILAFESYFHALPKGRRGYPGEWLAETSCSGRRRGFARSGAVHIGSESEN